MHRFLRRNTRLIIGSCFEQSLSLYIDLINKHPAVKSISGYYYCNRINGYSMLKVSVDNDHSIHHSFAHLQQVIGFQLYNYTTPYVSQLMLHAWVISFWLCILCKNVLCKSRVVLLMPFYPLEAGYIPDSNSQIKY